MEDCGAAEQLVLARKLVTDSTCRTRNGACKDYAAVATMLSSNIGG